MITDPQTELAGLEASATLYVRMWYREMPNDPGPVPWVAAKVRRLRELRGLEADAPVSIVVPRARGVVSVPLVESES